jgi:hypothetical protein
MSIDEAPSVLLIKGFILLTPPNMIIKTACMYSEAIQRYARCS